MPKIKQSPDESAILQVAIVTHPQAMGSLLHYLDKSIEPCVDDKVRQGNATEAGIEELLRASSALMRELSALRRDICRRGVASGLSARELSRQMGVSHSTVGVWLLPDDPEV